MASLTLKHGTRVERIVALDVPEFLVGRGSESHLELDQDVVSRRHCVFKQSGTGWVVEDLESSSGTVVQGRKIDRHLLRPGDEVQVGRFTLVFAEDVLAKPKTDKEMATGLFWTQAAEESGLTSTVEDKDGLKRDTTKGPAAPSGLQPSSAKEMAAKSQHRGDMDDFKQTMVASPEELARARKSLEATQRPHLSVTTKGKKEHLEIGEGSFIAGWEEGADYRFPGSKFLGKTAFIISRDGKKFSIEPQSFWTAVQVNGARLRGATKLKSGTTIEAGGVKFRFATGDGT